MASVATNITPATVNSFIGGTATWLSDTIIPGITPASITAIAGIVTDPDTVALINASCCRTNAGSMALSSPTGTGSGTWSRPRAPATVNSLLTDIGPWMLGALMPAWTSTSSPTWSIIPTRWPSSTACCRTWMRHHGGIVNTNVAWLKLGRDQHHPGHRQQHHLGTDPPWMALATHPHPGLNTAHIAGIANDADTFAFVNASAAAAQRGLHGGHRQHQLELDAGRGLRYCTRPR